MKKRNKKLRELKQDSQGIKARLAMKTKYLKKVKKQNRRKLRRINKF